MFLAFFFFFFFKYENIIYVSEFSFFLFDEKIKINYVDFFQCSISGIESL